MSKTRMLAQAALAEFSHPQRIGKIGQAGVTVRLLDDLRIACVIARRGALPELSARVENLLGIAPPVGPHRVERESLAILGIGPGRWMFVQANGPAAFTDELARNLIGLASISDHSDGYAVFEVGGTCVRQALAKGVAIDLHPESFGMTDVVVTSISHIGVILWQIDDTPHYRIAVFRSSAGSFWHWFSDSAQAFGIAVSKSADADFNHDR